MLFHINPSGPFKSDQLQFNLNLQSGYTVENPIATSILWTFHNLSLRKSPEDSVSSLQKTFPTGVLDIVAIGRRRYTKPSRKGLSRARKKDEHTARTSLVKI